GPPRGAIGIGPGQLPRCLRQNERGVALGRKNYLFVGNDEAGRNLAGLSSLVATCEANGVNPEAYLADVLMRLGSHPASRLDELLPHRWQPASASSPDSS
ncbi:transposase domain-containing protein, partial [Myxococcus sp. AS-1-15]|uniref:transposase domain-containing protein n=1 Tax=Myxococcus sp. AS-1-15 TaxID=2874600 RepID=UPI001CC11638